MSESEIQRRLAVVEEIRRLSYEMRAPHPLALGAVLAEYERRITMEAAAMGADVRCAMGSERYTDSDGNECDLPTMCRREQRQCGELHEHLALMVRYLEEEASEG